MREGVHIICILNPMHATKTKRAGIVIWEWRRNNTDRPPKGRLPYNRALLQQMCRGGGVQSKGGDGGRRRYWVNQKMCSVNPEVKQKAGIDCALMLASFLWLNEATHCWQKELCSYEHSRLHYHLSYPNRHQRKTRHRCFLGNTVPKVLTPIS